MVAYTENDRRHLKVNWHQKASKTEIELEIELKEKQFMHDEVEYYKEVKTKSKKNAYAENKNSRLFR